MPPPETEQKYRPSPQAVEILRERLQHMGVSISEPAARRLLESVLEIEGPRLDVQARAVLQTAVETIRRAAADALNALHGTASQSPRRDYELSFPPASDSPSVSGQRRKVPAPRAIARPNAQREVEEIRPEISNEEEPRPVFKRRRGR